jgi:PST family polysaccharide transporter
VKRIKRWFRSFRRTELGGFATDSFHIGLWQAAVSMADLAQLVLITHVLGLNAFGRLALAMSFVVLVGQFFDVRVGTAATKYGAERLADRDVEGLAGLLQLSYLIDFLAGLLSFTIILALAPLVGPRLVGGNGATLVVLYALTLLFSTVDDSSVSVLRLLDRFKLLATYSIGLEVLRVALIAGALAIRPSLVSVLIALIAYDLVGAFVNLAAANVIFLRTVGRTLRRRSLRAFDYKRQVFRMVLQTNVVSYARLAQVQLPTLVLGALSSTTQVAYYKVGASAASMVGRLTDPGYAAVLPRLSRLWASERRDEMRSLIARSTLVAAIVMGIALLVVIPLRIPILQLLGGTGAHHATTVLILASIGQAINGALFWNTSMLFAAGRAGAVATVALLGTALQVVLLVGLATLFQANGAAAALLVSYVAVNGVTTVLAVRAISGRRLGSGHETAQQSDRTALITGEGS